VKKTPVRIKAREAREEETFLSPLSRQEDLCFVAILFNIGCGKMRGICVKIRETLKGLET